MLSFQDFFAACAGHWIAERTYHYILENKIERSYTDFQVVSLEDAIKQPLLTGVLEAATLEEVLSACPGFAISFDTVSETGDLLGMSLKALFVPETYLPAALQREELPVPIAARLPVDPNGEVIRGAYLRDEGYSEAGMIAGRFTYQPSRHTLEMTTFYRRSVAVDQMRLIAPDTRLRTIVTYQRPEIPALPEVITLIGFGVERKQ